MTSENFNKIVIPHHTHDIGTLVLLTYPACDEWNLLLTITLLWHDIMQ